MTHNEKYTLLNKQLDLVAEFYLREIIRREYPQWIDDEGDCLQCADYYNSLLDAIVVS